LPRARRPPPSAPRSISKPHDISGINFGDGHTATVFALAVFVLVLYLAIARPDIQRPVGAAAKWSGALLGHP
jgi:hypothetical protein